MLRMASSQGGQMELPMISKAPTNSQETPNISKNVPKQTQKLNVDSVGDILFRTTS